MSITWKQAIGLMKKHGDGKVHLRYNRPRTCLALSSTGQTFDINLEKGAEPIHVVHELAHFILLRDRKTPWYKVPSWVCEGWRDGTLTGEWKAVAARAAEVDHVLVDRLVDELIASLE